MGSIRWNEESWEQIPIEADGNFESNPYIHALLDLTEGSPKGTFMSILVRDLIAKTAMIIEEMFTQLLQVQNAVFGGERFVLENGRLIDKGSQLPGFCLDKDGKLKASNAEISGHIDATSGKFHGELDAATGTFNGTLNAKNVNLSGTHTSGTNYLISSDNMAVYKIIPQGDTLETLKTIRVAGKGSCLIRLRLLYEKAGYKIYVNGVLSKEGSVASASTVDIPNVALDKPLNIIAVQGYSYLSSTAYFGMSTFEARVRDDPGLFAYMS